MALVIEDGTVVAGANSYVSAAEIVAYASARGVTISASDAEMSAVLAMDYLESFRSRYKGTKVSATQPLQWPRKDVVIDGADFPSNEIPKELKSAQCQSCIEIANGFELMPSTDNFAVSMEKVDVITVQYATGGSGQSPSATLPAAPKFPAVDALLRPLLAAAMYLSAVRA